MGDRVPPRLGRGAPQAWPLYLSLLLVSGCTDPQPDEPPEPSPTVAVVAPAVTATPAPAPTATPEALPGDADLPAAGPALIFDPVGLSGLYTRFFADPAQLDLLSRRFGALGMTQSIALEVSWDEPNKVGTITAFVPEQDRRSEALLAALDEKTAVPVERLSILMQPLGRYRAALAERFDLRILSFHLRLGFWDRSTGSYCSIKGDTNDPDGERLGSCFRCLEPRAGAVELCRDAPAWPAVITGDERGLRMLRSALRSQPAGG